MAKTQFKTTFFIFLLNLYLFTLVLFNYFWPRNELAYAFLSVCRWPSSPKIHLKYAKTLFKNGYEKEALVQIEEAEKLIAFWPQLFAIIGEKKELQQTKELVSKPAKIRAEINFWQEVLKQKPNSPDINLRLSILSAQLWQDEAAKAYWQKANYLDPNNIEVQKVGKLITGIEN